MFMPIDNALMPNTENVRNKAAALGFTLRNPRPLSSRHFTGYRCISFEYESTFKQIQQANVLYLYLDYPTITEDQAIFLLDILHVCPDIDTFNEAMQKYIDDSESVS